MRPSRLWRRRKQQQSDPQALGSAVHERNGSRATRGPFRSCVIADCADQVRRVGVDDVAPARDGAATLSATSCGPAHRPVSVSPRGIRHRMAHDSPCTAARRTRQLRPQRADRVRAAHDRSPAPEGWSGPHPPHGIESGPVYCHAADHRSTAVVGHWSVSLSDRRSTPCPALSPRLRAARLRLAVDPDRRRARRLRGERRILHVCSAQGGGSRGRWWR
jgi:hypothetical protein